MSNFSAWLVKNTHSGITPTSGSLSINSGGMIWHYVLAFKEGNTLIGLMGTIKGQHFTFYNSQDEASFY